MSRYEIRIQPPSEIAISYGITNDFYVVWDTHKNARVPFVNYQSREKAEARIQRMETQA